MADRVSVPLAIHLPVKKAMGLIGETHSSILAFLKQYFGN